MRRGIWSWLTTNDRLTKVPQRRQTVAQDFSVLQQND